MNYPISNQENQYTNHNIDHSCPEVRVIDNFLSEEFFTSLVQMVDYLPWTYDRYSVCEGDNQPQFVHGFYKDFEPTSEYWKYIRGVLPVLRPLGGLYRIKMNLTPSKETLIQKPFHVDGIEEDGSVMIHRVCVLYLNTNDGYTIFESTGEKVMSVANRAVLFPGHLRHAGTNCTDEPARIVLNIDYF